MRFLLMVTFAAAQIATAGTAPGCNIDLVQHGKQTGWEVTGIDAQGKMHPVPLSWPASWKEATDACHRFLEGKKTRKQRRKKK
jgi:hypothetical protein